MKEKVEEMEAGIPTATRTIAVVLSMSYVLLASTKDAEAIHRISSQTLLNVVRAMGLLAVLAAAALTEDVGTCLAIVVAVIIFVLRAGSASADPDQNTS